MHRHPTQTRRPDRRPVLISAAVSVAAAAVLAFQMFAPASAQQTLSIAAPHPLFDQQPVRRCINVAAALEAPPGENWGYTIDVEDFSRIRDAGFDTIRLPVKWSAYTGPGPDYRIDPRFLNEVRAYIDQALRRGVQVMLNVHHFDAFNERPREEEARLMAIWAQLSTAFRDYPDGLIFELINEPHFEAVEGVGDEDYSRPTGIARMNRINAALIRKLRPTHSNRWIVLGSSQWGTHYPLTEGVNGTRFAPGFDPRVITTFHYYEPIEFTHQNLEFADHPTFPRDWGTRADLRHVAEQFSKIAQFRESAGHNMPVLLGEFGTSTEMSAQQRRLWTSVLREQSEAHAMGWCVFDFASPGFGLFDAGRKEWNGDLLHALMPGRD